MNAGKISARGAIGWWTIVLAWCVMSGVYAASAQSIQVLPSYCKSSTLTGDDLMRKIRRIVAHADLTDVAFTEKTLEAKFSFGYGWGEDGKPDPKSQIYQSDEVLGAPIHVKYSITDPALVPTATNLIALMRIEDLPDSSTNFIDKCLQITGGDFFSYFGQGFEPFGVSPSSTLPVGTKIQNSTDAQDNSEPLIKGYWQDKDSLGKNFSRFHLVFIFGQRSNGWPDEFISSVIIEQDRQP